MQCLQTARIQLIIVIFSQHLSDKYEVGYLRCSKIFITAGYAMTHTFVVVVKVGRATVSVAVNNKIAHRFHNDVSSISLTTVT